MRLGCVGLAGAGGELATKFLAREPLSVWDTDAAVVAEFVKAGAQPMASAADVGDRCDVIVTCAPEGSGVQEFLFGVGGLGEKLAAGKIIIDTSVGDPRQVSAAADRLAGRGVAMIDLSVSILATGSSAGNSMLLVSGADEALDTVSRFLTEISPSVIRCGRQPGDARAVRLIASTMTIASGLGTLEAIAAGRKMGLTLRSMIDVLNKGSGRNYMTGSVLPALADGKAALNVPLARMLHDINAAISMSVACAAPTPIASVARGLLQAASNTLDGSALFGDLAQSVESMAKTNLVDTESGPASVSAATARTDQFKVGYIGLGAMGAPLARRLMLSYETQVFDARADAARTLEAEGAFAARNLASLARECDVIVLCVPSSAVVREVLFGRGGVAEGLSPGKIVVDQTTGDPLEARSLAAELQKLGVSMVDAPVTGGPETAQAGTATIICGGSHDTYQRVLPVLTSISPNVIYCGPTGSGHAAKLVNNASNIGNRLIAYEAALLGRKYGLALGVLDEVVNKSTAWSFASQRVFKAVATRAQTANISLELSLKDIWSAVHMGIGCGAPMVIADTVRSLFETGVNQFGGDANVDEMARLFEQMGQIDFTSA